MCGGHFVGSKLACGGDVRIDKMSLTVSVVLTSGQRVSAVVHPSDTQPSDRRRILGIATPQGCGRVRHRLPPCTGGKPHHAPRTPEHTEGENDDIKTSLERIGPRVSRSARIDPADASRDLRSQRHSRNARSRKRHGVRSTTQRRSSLRRRFLSISSRRRGRMALASRFASYARAFEPSRCRRSYGSTAADKFSARQRKMTSLSERCVR